MAIRREFDRWDEWIAVEEGLPLDFDNLCEYDAFLICVAGPRGKFPGNTISIGTNTGPDNGWEILGNSGYFSDTGLWELKSEDITHWKFINGPINTTFQRFKTFESTCYKDANMYLEFNTNDIEKLRASLKFVGEKINDIENKGDK